jgi:hypothetical protein
MAIPQTAVALASGQSVSVPVANPNRVQCVEIYNGTPYDLTVSGYGVIGGGIIIPAGLGHRLFGDVYNSGSINMVAVNNTGATSTGVVNLTYYEADEKLPPGHFPVTVPVQTVSAKVSGVQTLSNEGSTLGAEVIDIGTTANSKLIDIFNNHFTLSIEIGGVKHTILAGSLTGSPGQAGMAGDVFEILGQLLVDQDVTLSGNETSGAVGKLLHALGNLTVDGTTTLTGALTATNASSLVQKANTLADIANLPGGRLGVSAAGDVLDAASSTATYIKSRGAGGGFHFQTPDGSDQVTIDNVGNVAMFGFTMRTGGMHDLNNGSNLSGTINHGLVGGTPSWVLATCNTTSSSATTGAYSYTTTQFGLTVGGGLNAEWVAKR